MSVVIAKLQVYGVRMLLSLLKYLCPKVPLGLQALVDPYGATIADCPSRQLNRRHHVTNCRWSLPIVAF